VAFFSSPFLFSVAEVHTAHTCNYANFFLDGFQVWDKNGADITKSFTPILKQLLILIILYSGSCLGGTIRICNDRRIVRNVAFFSSPFLFSVAEVHTH